MGQIIGEAVVAKPVRYVLGAAIVVIGGLIGGILLFAILGAMLKSDTAVIVVGSIFLALDCLVIGLGGLLIRSGNRVARERSEPFTETMPGG